MREYPVYLPSRVLREVTEVARAAGCNEAGGILLGRLHVDPGVPEIFAEVTAQIEAHAHAELTQLAFTAATWQDLEQAVKLRQRPEESCVGWWHSHSFLKKTCVACPQLKAGSCKASAAFFSLQDMEVQRACFPKAYSVALVVAESPAAGLNFSLFGWQQGRIAARGYYEFENTPQLQTVARLA